MVDHAAWSKPGPTLSVRLRITSAHIREGGSQVLERGRQLVSIESLALSSCAENTPNRPVRAPPAPYLAQFLPATLT